MKDIAKHYPLLTADERFRLFIAAMGRKDEEELDRLEATCPRRSYNAQDYQYTRKKSHFMVLALATALQALRIDLFAHLSLVAVLASEDEMSGAAEGGKDAFQKLMRARHGKREGWLRFCERIGVDPDAIAAPFVEDVEWAMETAETIWKEFDDDGDGPATSETIATRELEALIDAWGASD